MEVFIQNLGTPDFQNVNFLLFNVFVGKYPIFPPNLPLTLYPYSYNILILHLDILYLCRSYSPCLIFFLHVILSSLSHCFHFSFHVFCNFFNLSLFLTLCDFLYFSIFYLSSYMSVPILRSFLNFSHLITLSIYYIFFGPLIVFYILFILYLFSGIFHFSNSPSHWSILFLYHLSDSLSQSFSIPFCIFFSPSKTHFPSHFPSSSFVFKIYFIVKVFSCIFNFFSLIPS